MTMRHAFVGRQSDIERMREWLHVDEWKRDDTRVHVVSIAGPGGVGKSRFYEHARTEQLLRSGEYLELTIAGHRHRDDRDLFSWVRRMARAASKQLKPGTARFSKTEREVEYHEELMRRVVHDLRIQQVDDKTVEMAQVMQSLVRLGERAAKRDLRKLFRDESASDVQKVWEAVTDPRFVSVARGAARGVKDLLRPALWQHKKHPLNSLAQAFVFELNALLGKATEYSRLLLVIDDYEFLENVVGRFLVEELLLTLEHADFRSLVVLLGRDQLVNTSEGLWAQQPHDTFLADREIVLSPLSKAEVFEMCESSQPGLGLAARERVFRESMGYPWLVEDVLENLAPAGHIPAVAYDRFFDRVSRFMGDTERSWFKELCYLDRITVTSVREFLDLTNNNEAQQVLDWFKREHSIRSSESEHRVVWPYIRYRVLRAAWLDDDELFVQKARRAKLTDIRYSLESGPEPPELG